MDSSSGFNVLDRKTSLNSDFLRWMKTTDSGSKISIMPAAAAHHHQTNPFSLGDGDGGGGATMYRDHVSSYSCTSMNDSISGGGMAFTGAQWKELERQAMIYKCMISCVPVPHHLLFPVYGGRYSRKVDPEPGRCKRTDGKKWRCSREVAPQQKYCDRHLHRGRPRSRKPVEAINKKTQTHLLHKPKLTNTNTETNSLLFQPGQIASSKHKQPWENLMVDLDYPLQEPPLNLFSYPQIHLPTGFIETWSIDNINSRSDGATVESESDLSPTLDLSMAMGMAVQQIHCECDDDFHPTISWEPLARGGPLGEALQPGSVAGSTPASPSGVLRRTLFSHSDGSVCNSPTLAAEISKLL